MVEFAGDFSVLLWVCTTLESFLRRVHCPPNLLVCVRNDSQNCSSSVFQFLRWSFSENRSIFVALKSLMFTGLVEGQGTVIKVSHLPVGLRLTIEPDSACFAASSIAIGDSISICGCCLTVVAIQENSLDFEAGLETLSKTTLGDFREGTRVNLERSLRAESRLGGHFVQGHVDGTAQVLSVERNGDWIDMWFQPAEQQLRLLVPKGSVAVDGVSLTVVNVQSDRFSVALIPHTLSMTTLGQVQAASRVNIENDILGKYVDHLLQGRLAALHSAGPATSNSSHAASFATTTLTESPAPQ